MSIENDEKQLDGLIGKEQFVRRFIERLGNPSDYEYTGLCYEAENAECVCGHMIKYCFQIAHKVDKSKTAIVGSVCIDHFAGYSQGLFESLLKAKEALKLRLSEDKKRAKEASQKAEVQILADKFITLKAQARVRYLAIRQSGKRASYDLWFIVVRGIFVKQYKRPCDYIRFYKAQIERIETAINQLPE